MGLDNRKKTNQIFDGSKLNVPGQGIKTVQTFKDILKDKNSLFSPSDLQIEKNQPIPTPPPTKTPNPTPNNTPTQTVTQTLTPTITRTERIRKTPLPTRTPEKTPSITNSVSISLTPSKTNGATPLPTRTYTPTNTMTKTIGITPTCSITPTIGATPSYTPSLTQTLTPNGCFCYEINITQSDLDSAYGNEIQSSNNKIVVQYFNCYEELITFTASTSGIYYICNRKFETINNLNVECLLTFTQLDLVYTNYLNPDYFSSTVSTFYSSCSTTFGCQPPTPTISQTITMTPSITSTMTLTPTITPSNPPTPTVTPSFTTTPTMTMTVTEYPCFNFDVTITQTDIDRASGNTEVNGVVSIVYYSCDSELVTELEVTTSGVYTICNKYKKTNQIYKQNVYLVYTQDDEAYNNYDNPEKFTSSFVRTSTVCPTLPPPPPPPPCNPLDSNPLVFEFAGQSTPSNLLTMSFQLSASAEIIVDWGDGNIESNSGTQLTFNHTYSSNWTQIKLYCCYYNLITKFLFNESSANSGLTYRYVKFDISQISVMTNIDSLILTIVDSYGDISVCNQFNNLMSLSLKNNVTTNSLFGSIENLSQNIVSIVMNGNSNLNNITGSLNNFNYPLLKTININIKNSISGDIDSLSNSPELTSIILDNSNTVGGDISNLSLTELKFISVTGSNTITGDLSNLLNNSPIIKIGIYGDNTITGNLSDFNIPTLTTVYILGNNTITGTINNIGVNVSLFIVAGDNTISGDIGSINVNLNKLSTFEVRGNNTISGALDGFPHYTNLTRFIVAGNNTITSPSNNFAQYMQSGPPLCGISFAPVYPGGLTSQEIDVLLNQLSNRIKNISSCNTSIIDLTGTNQPRTSNSDVAVAILIQKTFIVLTN